MAYIEKTFWQCLVCKDKPEFEHREFIKHAQEVHKIKDGTQAESKGILFLDGADWYKNTYEVNVGDMKFIKYVEGKRTGKDKWV